MNRGNKGNSPFRWQNTRLEGLVKQIDNGVDSCSEHFLIIHRGQSSGPGELSVFGLFNSSNTIEAVIIMFSDLGIKTSDSIDGNLAKFSSVKTLAKYEYYNSAFF